MKYFLTLCLSLLTAVQGAYGQLIIGSNTNMTTGDITIATNNSVLNQGRLHFGSGADLYLTGQGTLSAIPQLNIPNLYMLGSNYAVTGSIFCQESLQLKNGTLTPKASAKLVVDRTAIVISENEAHVNGRLYHAGENNRFYPIGKNGVYTPVSLIDVGDEREIGLEAFNRDLGVDQFPADISAASPNWFWEIIASADFSGARIKLPVTSDDAGLIGVDGNATVLESDLNGENVKDLGRGTGSDFLSITSELPFTGLHVLLGFESELKPVIHNIITPKNDDKNPFLVIDHIDAIAENEVILLDRWGNEVFRERNFTNYAKNGIGGRPYDGAFDALPSGNYICLLKYQGVIKKQVVTLLEE